MPPVVFALSRLRMPPLAMLIAPLIVAPLTMRSRELAIEVRSSVPVKRDAVEEVAAAAGGREDTGADWR